MCFSMVKLFKFNGHTPLLELEVAIYEHIRSHNTAVRGGNASPGMCSYMVAIDKHTFNLN